MIDEIYEEIKKRNITRLCHFVHTNILLHILNNNEGVKAVDFIKQDVLIQNDKQRMDGKTDYINCSVQYPNPDKPEKLFLFSTPCVILKKKGVFICYSLINTLIKFMASLPVMTA